jgi:hypothetical protein
VGAGVGGRRQTADEGVERSESLPGPSAIQNTKSEIFVGAWVVTLPQATGFELVWSFADVMNGLMAFPNLIGLLLLSGVVARETREYFRAAGPRRSGRITYFRRERPSRDSRYFLTTSGQGEAHRYGVRAALR